MKRRLHAAGSALLVLAVLLTGCAGAEAKKARFLAQARKFVGVKDYPRAILDFRNALRLAPMDSDIQLELGKAYLAAGDARSATASFRRATELNPGLADAQLMLAQQLARSGEIQLVDEARDRARGVLERSPEKVEAIQTLAMAEAQLGEPDEAERHLRQALSKFPQNLESSVYLSDLLLARKDFKGAETVLKNAADQAPNAPEMAVALAAFYVMSGNPNAAKEQIGRALNIDRKNGPALLLLGKVQRDAGMGEEAEKTYRELSALAGYKPAHAMYLLESGKTSEGIAELEKLAAADHGDTNLRRRLVSAYESAGRHQDSEKLLTAAMKSKSNDPELLFRRGEVYLAMRRYTDAQADVNKLLHSYPASPDAHYLLARISNATGDTANWTQQLQEAIRYGPDFLQARMDLAQSFIDSNSPRAALNLLNEAPKAQQRTLPFIAQRNWALLAVRDFPELSKGLDDAFALGRQPEILLQAGLMQLETKKPAAAQPLIEEALRSNPEDPRIVRALARCYLDQKQTVTGLAAFKEYAAQRPKSPWAQEALGEWYVLTGNNGDARQAFSDARALDPQFRSADVMLVHLDIKEGKLNSARERLRQMLAVNEKDAGSHYTLAGLEYQDGKVASALAHFKRAVDLQPSNAVALNDLAYVLMDSGQIDEAIKYAQSAQEKAPENAAINDTLGWALYQKHVYKTAVQHLQKAAAGNGNAVHRYHLAMAYVKMGDLDLGEDTFEAALKIDPNVPEASMARQLIADSVRQR